MIRESVWDYPRPPRVEQSARLVKVVLAGTVVAQTRRASRVLETSHPPVYYIPLQDVRQDLLSASPQSSFCEFKGSARYYTLTVGDWVVPDAGWFYPDPSPGYESIRDQVAFYPGRVDECTVDGEPVLPQAGGFYGGWITSEVDGPFKGEPGTRGW